MDSWFDGLEDAMDLLSSSRRVSRLSVVSRRSSSSKSLFEDSASSRGKSLFEDTARTKSLFEDKPKFESTSRDKSLFEDSARKKSLFDDKPKYESTSRVKSVFEDSSRSSKPKFESASKSVFEETSRTNKSSFEAAPGDKKSVFEDASKASASHDKKSIFEDSKSFFDGDSVKKAFFDDTRRSKSLFEDGGIYGDLRSKERPKWRSELRSRFRHVPKADEKEHSDSLKGDHEELKRKLKCSQEETLKLQAVITDLTEVNKRWQKYNGEHQTYVQKLLTMIQDQQEQLNDMGKNRACAENPVVSSTTGKSNCSNENCLSVAAEVVSLKRVEMKLKEQIEVLQFQVKAHRDDWEAERTEKRQAVLDKESAEMKVNQLIIQLQKVQALANCENGEEPCECCGKQNAELYPAQNKLFRTAVHLPCSRDHGRTKTSPYILDDNLVCDGRSSNVSRSGSERSIKAIDSALKDCPFESSVDEKSSPSIDSGMGNTEESLWNISASGAGCVTPDLPSSYSRSSTLPLGSPPTQAMSGSKSSLNRDSYKLGFSKSGLATVTSFVEIPISKSCSAPERKLTCYSQPSQPAPGKFSATPPVSTLSEGACFSAANNEGVDTETREDIICPGCTKVFTPEMHLQFLDHFEKCQNAPLH